MSSTDSKKTRSKKPRFSSSELAMMAKHPSYVFILRDGEWVNLRSNPSMSVDDAQELIRAIREKELS